MVPNLEQLGEPLVFGLLAQAAHPACRAVSEQYGWYVHVVVQLWGDVDLRVRQTEEDVMDLDDVGKRLGGVWMHLGGHCSVQDLHVQLVDPTVEIIGRDSLVDQKKQDPGQ